MNQIMRLLSLHLITRSFSFHDVIDYFAVAKLVPWGVAVFLITHINGVSYFSTMGARFHVSAVGFASSFIADGYPMFLVTNTFGVTNSSAEFTSNLHDINGNIFF